MKLEDIDLMDLDRFWRREHDEMFTLLRREDPVHWQEMSDNEASGEGTDSKMSDSEETSSQVSVADKPTASKPASKGFWNLTKHADLVMANRNTELFSSELDGSTRYTTGNSSRSSGFDTRGVMMINTDPPKHTRYRLLVNKGFTPRMIRLLEEALRIRATEIVNQVIEKGECDFVEDLASELPLQAIAEIMGVPQEDRKTLFEWSNKIAGSEDPEYADQGMTAAMELYAYANNLGKQRAIEPKDDIATLLINATIGEDRLSEQEFDAFMLMLILAGNETTRNATSGGMLALLQHPEEMSKLRADIDDIDTKLDTATDEILRWTSPLMHFYRTATADTEIRGKKITKGDRVILWHVSANRDEEVFDNPFKFDIERTPNEHISFGGGGAHYCLGANLAKTELRIIFREMLTRMNNIQLAGDPDFLRSNFLQGIKHMPITFTPGERVSVA